MHTHPIDDFTKIYLAFSREFSSLGFDACSRGEFRSIFCFWSRLSQIHTKAIANRIVECQAEHRGLTS